MHHQVSSPTGKCFTKKFSHKLGTLQDIIDYLATEGYDSQKYNIFMHPKTNVSFCFFVIMFDFYLYIVNKLLQRLNISCSCNPYKVQ